MSCRTQRGPIPLSASNETDIGMAAILGYAGVSTTGEALMPNSPCSVLPGSRQNASSPTSFPARRMLVDRDWRDARLRRCRRQCRVTAISRLGRSVAEVTRTIAELAERRILLRTLC